MWPCRYCFWISSTFVFACLMRAFFASGMTMSSMPMVAPNRVAYLKPSSFTASSTFTVTAGPSRW